MAVKKLTPLSRLTINKKEGVSLITASEFEQDREAYDKLFMAQQYWDRLRDFREERARNKRYCYGRQWDDRVTTGGRSMKEEDFIKTWGTPLKNNLIRRLVRTVLGAYRNQNKEPTCVARDRDEQQLGETMSTVLEYNWQLNKMNEVNARTFEDFLISGFVVHKKTFGWRNGKEDEWTDYVDPNMFFIDNCMTDFRGWDASFMGQIHDVTFEELCAQFAHSPKDYEKLRNIYSYARNRQFISNCAWQFGHKELKNYEFLMPTDTALCRVIEVWEKKAKRRYRCHDYLNGELFKVDPEDLEQLVLKVNKERIRQGEEAGMAKDDIPLIAYEWFMDTYWHYSFLTPFGQVLDSGETPYEHGEHPYVFKIYPFIDGEVHSFVADVIDQQRYVNRLITLYDWIMRASAKGVLLFPESCKPDDMDMDEIAENWTRFNGMIVFKPDPKVPNAIPQQIANNCTNIGINELLQLQLKFFEDISGVSGALQGKPGFSGQSASLYQQQTQNATTSLLDLFETFSSFIQDGARKDVKNIQQFYDDKKYINIAGKGSAIVYDPEKVKDVDYDISIQETQDTPVYRAVANDFLMEIWKAGQISLEQLLEFGNFPFADQLLQSIQSQKEAIQNGQTPEGLSPQLQQQVQQQAAANPQAVAQAQQALG